MHTNTVTIVISHYILSMKSFSLSVMASNITLTLTALALLYQPNFTFAFSTACGNTPLGNTTVTSCSTHQKRTHNFPY